MGRLCVLANELRKWSQDQNSGIDTIQIYATNPNNELAQQTLKFIKENNEIKGLDKHKQELKITELAENRGFSITIDENNRALQTKVVEPTKTVDSNNIPPPQKQHSRWTAWNLKKAI